MPFLASIPGSMPLDALAQKIRVSHISEGSHVLSIGKAMTMASETPNMSRKGNEP